MTFRQWNEFRNISKGKNLLTHTNFLFSIEIKASQNLSYDKTMSYCNLILNQLFGLFKIYCHTVINITTLPNSKYSMSQNISLRILFFIFEGWLKTVQRYWNTIYGNVAEYHCFLIMNASINVSKFSSTILKLNLMRRS